MLKQNRVLGNWRTGECSRARVPSDYFKQFLRYSNLERGRSDGPIEVKCRIPTVREASEEVGDLDVHNQLVPTCSYGFLSNANCVVHRASN